MRAFASQKGPGKGLPASGFAPERRESPEFPRAPRSSRSSVLTQPGIDLASALARMDLSQRGQVTELIARIEEQMARADAEEARCVATEAQIAEAVRRRVAAEARIAESNRQIAEEHANDQFPAGG